MRDDVYGLFWDDTPAPKVTKTKEKRTPPDAVWEAPGYYEPEQYERAVRFEWPHFTDAELVAAQASREPLQYDVESYPNFWCVSFWSDALQRVAYFELSEWAQLDIPKLRWVFTQFCIVGFNSNSFDLYLVELAIAGWDEGRLFEATVAIIRDGLRGGDLLRAHKVKRLKVDHIDLIEVAPLSGSLKAYGARLFAEELQDLPFPVGTWLTEEQATIVRVYNVNDLKLTALVCRELVEQLKLRITMSHEYGVDLRSKSDAQIAEAVISKEMERLTGVKPERIEVQPGMAFRFDPPAFLQYRTPLLNQMFDRIRAAVFTIDEFGYVVSPKEIEMQLEIAGATYTMGIGGLHSNEKRAAHYSTPTSTIYDRDVTSYYPALILNSGMYPVQLGPAFLHIYKRIVDERVTAKANKNKVKADSLKITANGTFGKLGSPWSILYSPKQMIQVTLSGQLSLLMLIERMELAGIRVVSANTDGIVMNVPNNLHATYLAIIAQWEQETNLRTEESVYHLIASRDVNSYMAVTTPDKDGKVKVKGKGAYSNVWWSEGMEIFRFHKNPVNLVCTRAVEEYLTTGRHPVDTVNACTDPVYFATVRNVKGGGVKDGKMLGKLVRWYYGEGEKGDIVYASSGNTVARSTGARPMMALPRELPADLDRGWYITEALDMIRDLGLEPPVPRPPA